MSNTINRHSTNHLMANSRTQHTANSKKIKLYIKFEGKATLDRKYMIIVANKLKNMKDEENDLKILCKHNFA